ncbi:KLD7A protein, partial [Psilopogon haemacephalus]|nr:KLD7A protein [Psilopogon haemacephalus]
KMPQQVTLPWHFDMQLASKLVLSAAALLLLTLAYRFYKSRSLAGGKSPPVEVGEERESASRDEDGDGDGVGGLRWRRGLGEEGRRGGGDGEERGQLSGGGKRCARPCEDRRLPRGEEEEVGEEGEEMLGSELASKPRSKLGSDPGNDPERKIGRGPRNEPGSQLGSKLGSQPGREPRSYDSGGTAKSRLVAGLGQLASLSPGSQLPPGPGDAQMGGNGHNQSTEQDLAIRGVSQEAEGCREMIQTLSITSGLGLTMTASNEGSDASYSFSSVAKIQVEENYIAERRVKDGAGKPVPGLKGKVYDYYVQSVSQSVSKKRSSLYIPPGTSQRSSLEGVNKELKSRSATQESDPAPATQESDPASPKEDFTISSTVPSPAGSLEISFEPPSPDRKVSILQTADSPHLQLPTEGVEVPTAVTTPPASPQPGLAHSTGFIQLSPSAHVDLGNCYQVLCTAKAQKLSDLQEAAYKVMSDNYLQVLRTPSIYGRLNAGERELILRRRMKGKRYVAVAEVSPQEPGLHASRLCYYDDAGDCWHHLCQLPPEVVSRGCAMCSMFNYLFVVAGCKGTGRTQRASNRVFCYDPLTNTWGEISPLNQGRPHCKLVALDGHLYAIGGECLYTVERYDPRQDRWTFAAPLPHDTFAVAHTATVCDGEIYVTGGTLRYVLLRYAARSDTWSVSPASGAKERTVEMVSANGFIYRFDLQRGTGVAVSRCSAKAKLWYQCAAHPAPDLPGFQCAVVGSLVHCLGRHFHVRFLADPVSPRFGTKELQPFPSPRGSLLPAVLVLPEAGAAQTQV